MSRAVELFVYGTGLPPHCCYHVHECNKVFVLCSMSLCSTQWYRKLLFSHFDFYCGNTTAFFIFL